MRRHKAYTDGSFINGQIKWAFQIYRYPDELIFSDSGILEADEEMLTGRQIAGELHAAKMALTWAVQTKNFIDIFYDYSGVFEFVRDLFDGSKKHWECKKGYTKNYREFIKSNCQYIMIFEKVVAHSTDQLNISVDRLAKIAK